MSSKSFRQKFQSIWRLKKPQPIKQKRYPQKPQTKLKWCKVPVKTSCGLCMIENQAQVHSEVSHESLTFKWAKVHVSYNLGIFWLLSPPGGGLPDQTTPSMTYHCVLSCWTGHLRASVHVLLRGRDPPIPASWHCRAAVAPISTQKLTRSQRRQSLCAQPWSCPALGSLVPTFSSCNRWWLLCGITGMMLYPFGTKNLLLG